jgi:hypothetical protein
MPTMLVNGVVVEITPEQEAALPKPLPPPPPRSVTNFQARAVLRSRFMPDGTSLLSAVTAHLVQARDAAAGLAENAPQRIAADLAWQAWEQSNTVERDSAIVGQFAALFGLSATDLDQLFRAAAEVTA